MLVWVILFTVISIGLFWYARHQPFPEHGNLAGSIFVLTALILYIALGSPRPTAATVPPVLAIILGGWFTIIGGYHMGRTQRDVIVAPFSGIVLVSGIFGLVTLDWTEQTTTEQIGNFILASIFVLLEIYKFTQTQKKGLEKNDSPSKVVTLVCNFYYMTLRFST